MPLQTTVDILRRTIGEPLCSPYQFVLKIWQKEILLTDYLFNATTMNGLFLDVYRPVLENWMSIVSILVIFLPGITYLISTLRALVSINQAGNGKKPPTIPYWIPYLGNLIPFVRDTAGFLEEVSCVLPPILASIYTSPL